MQTWRIRMTLEETEVFCTGPVNQSPFLGPILRFEEWDQGMVVRGLVRFFVLFDGSLYASS